MFHIKTNKLASSVDALAISKSENMTDPLTDRGNYSLKSAH